MIFHKTSLPGLFVIDMQPFVDDRGLFARTFCAREFSERGLETHYVQCNHSSTKSKGTIRGMHYQNPPHAEVKLIRCTSGAVWDVVIDVRAGSPTFLQHVGVELSAINGKMMYIPKGFAHGFQTLSDEAQLAYQHSSYYYPDAESGLHYADPALNIAWPLPVSRISEKDKIISFIDDTFTGITLDGALQIP